MVINPRACSSSSKTTIVIAGAAHHAMPSNPPMCPLWPGPMPSAPACPSVMTSF